MDLRLIRLFKVVVGHSEIGADLAIFRASRCAFPQQLLERIFLRSKRCLGPATEYHPKSLRAFVAH
jgi:hypothetical protein